MDITDAKAAAAQLMESEQRLKSAQELAHVGSWHWDLTTDRVSCSEELSRILGQPDSYSPSFVQCGMQINDYPALCGRA